MLQISLISPKNQEIIHEKSLHILEKTGVAFNYEPALQLLKLHGAKIDGQTAYIRPIWSGNVLVYALQVSL